MDKSKAIEKEEFWRLAIREHLGSGLTARSTNRVRSVPKRHRFDVFPCKHIGKAGEWGQKNGPMVQ